MKVIRKRLQVNPAANGWRQIGYTLTVCLLISNKKKKHKYCFSS